MFAGQVSSLHYTTTLLPNYQLSTKRSPNAFKANVPEHVSYRQKSTFNFIFFPTVKLAYNDRKQTLLISKCSVYPSLFTYKTHICRFDFFPFYPRFHYNRICFRTLYCAALRYFKTQVCWEMRAKKPTLCKNIHVWT